MDLANPYLRVDGKELIGSAGSDALYYAQELVNNFKRRAKFVSVRRPVEEVVQSLSARNLPSGYLDDALRAQVYIEAHTDCTIVDFHGIDLEIMSAVCEHVGVPWEPSRMEALLRYNVQSTLW